MMIRFEPTRQEAWLLAATFAVGLMLGIAVGPLFMFGFVGAVVGGWLAWTGLNALNRWRTRRVMERIRAVLRDELKGGKKVCHNTVDFGKATAQGSRIEVEDDSVDDKYAHGE